jgi:hypothetical protein
MEALFFTNAHGLITHVGQFFEFHFSQTTTSSEYQKKLKNKRTMRSLPVLFL